MQRGEFKRKLPPARPVKQYQGANPSAARAPAVRVRDERAQMVVPVPKFVYVRSEALMKAYRLIPCQGCGRADGTVCGAHSNWAVHGKGRSVKASDDRCASLCFACHQELDQGSAFTEAQRRMFWWRSHVNTVANLAHFTLWPAGVPVPDVEQFPEQWA
jgi:hypothetical protein